MAVFQFSASDVNSGKLIIPGWYPFKINSFKLDKAKKDGSKLFVYEAEGLEGDSTGVTMLLFFSEKFASKMVKFFEALGADVEAGTEVDLDAPVGETVEIYVGHRHVEASGGKAAATYNDPTDFRKVGAGA